MSKNLLKLGLLSIFLVIPEVSKSFYIGVGAGNSNIKADGDNFNGEVAYSAFVGFELPIVLLAIRSEFEYTHLLSKHFEIGEITTSGAGFNAYVDIPLLPVLEPYIGFGLGYMEQTLDIDEDSSLKSNWKLVPKYIMGLDLDLPTIPIAGSMEYRYSTTNFTVEETGIDYKAKIHTVLVKARYKF